MFAEERRKQLLQRIEQAGSLTNTAAAAEFQVSMLTIRRDLEQLEQDGFIRRVYGGAQHISVPVLEPVKGVEFRQRLLQNLEAKTRIAERATDSICEGETIYLDAGTTALAMAKAITARGLRNIRIVTHAVNITNEFTNYTQCKVFSVGGELYEETGACTGQFTLDTIRRFHYDRFFLGCMGFDVINGMTNARIAEVDIKNAVIEKSNWVCLIADSSKWNSNNFAPIAPLERCHRIITDTGLNPNARHQIKQQGIELELV
jgi:DeoR/GlpR family transcriptional regulator of sugar metabolism